MPPHVACGELNDSAHRRFSFASPGSAVGYRQRRIVRVDAAVDVKGRVRRITVARAEIYRKPSEVLHVAETMQRRGLLHLLQRPGHQIQAALQTVRGE